MTNFPLCFTLVLFVSFPCFADSLNQDTLRESSNRNVAQTPIFGAELHSFDKVHFGKFVVRMKLVSEPGVVSSFFTYDNESWQGGNREWAEIDFEAVGKNVNVLQTNLITGTASKRIHNEHNSTVNGLKKFHVYTLEWTPDKIVWLVNGKAIREENSESSQQVIDIGKLPQTYRANIWISEVVDWVGKFDHSSLPLYQVIDWIEYHRFNTDGSYTLDWRDDFNTFDNKRWGKGDWGFDSNIVTFSPNNIRVVDGHLVLALTEGDKGLDIDDYRMNLKVVSHK